MIPEASGPVAVIDNDRDLRALVATLRGAGWVAVDTEFVRERTYYPQLCLIQIAGGTQLACLDPLALTDLSPLTSLLTDPGIVKVFHAASQDLEILLQEVGVLPTPVFDTQIAATLLGHADQVGYARLVADRLGTQLAKAHSRTDWSRRPLSVEEIAYAADDVRYLEALYPSMRDELARRGRLDWLVPEFAALTEPGRYTPNPAQAWRRVKGLSRLRAGQQQALARLAEWRETTAISRDRPRGWIIKDDVLVDIARRRPETAAELARVRGLPEPILRRDGDAVLACIKAAADAPAETLATAVTSLPAEQLPLVDLLMAGLRAQAAAADISAGALAGRKDLERLVAGERDLPVLQGWRRVAVGDALLALLAGELQVRATAEGITLEAAADKS